MLKSLQEPKFEYLQSARQIKGILNSVLQEHAVSQAPLPFVIDKMCKVIHSSTPSFLLVLSQLALRGHKIVPSYMHEGQYKSTASIRQVYDLLVQLKRQQVGDRWLQNLKQDEAGYRICKRVTDFPQIDMDFKLKKEDQPVLFKHFFGHQQKHMGPKGRPQKRQLSAQELQNLIKKGQDL